MDFLHIDDTGFKYDTSATNLICCCFCVFLTYLICMADCKHLISEKVLFNHYVVCPEVYFIIYLLVYKSK